MLELLLLVIPMLFAGGDPPVVVVDPGKPTIPGYSLHEMPDGTWQVARIFPDGGVAYDGPYVTEAIAKIAAENWLATQQPQGGGAPEQPAADVPPVCSTLIVVTADEREASLCKQGNVWRIYKDGDQLMPATFVDPGKAAQRIVTLVRANQAQVITISTSSARTEVRKLGPNQFHWKVSSSSTGVGLGAGVEPSLLDAMGKAYETAGGLD